MSTEVSIEDNSKQVKKELERLIPIALEECGLAAERFAKTGITRQGAVDTGLLRNSITHAISGQAPAITSYKDDDEVQEGTYDGTAPEAEKNQMSVFVGTNVEYAPYVENGTTKMAERPFIKPAVTDHQSDYRKIIESRLKG